MIMSLIFIIPGILYNSHFLIYKLQDNAPTKLFIGRLPSDTTDGDLKDYFSNFGEIVDIFVPNPFRGFGFVTYSSQEEAIDVLNGTHKIKVLDFFIL